MKNSRAKNLRPMSIIRYEVIARERRTGCTVRIWWVDSLGHSHADQWDTMDPPQYVAISLKPPRPKPLNADYIGGIEGE